MRTTTLSTYQQPNTELLYEFVSLRDFVMLLHEFNLQLQSKAAFMCDHTKVILTTKIVWITTNVKVLYRLPMLSKKKKKRSRETRSSFPQIWIFTFELILPATFFRPQCKCKGNSHFKIHLTVQLRSYYLIFALKWLIWM